MSRLASNSQLAPDLARFEAAAASIGVTIGGICQRAWRGPEQGLYNCLGFRLEGAEYTPHGTLVFGWIELHRLQDGVNVLRPVRCRLGDASSELNIASASSETTPEMSPVEPRTLEFWQRVTLIQ